MAIRPYRSSRLSRGSPERFRRLVQRSPDMISIYDEDGRYAFANAAHTRVLGYEPAELVGRFPLDFVHPDDRAMVAEAFTAQITAGAPALPVEMRIRCRDGTYKYVESVAVDLRGEPAVGGVLVTARDVSDRRRSEMFARDQATILEQIARGAPLEQVAAEVCHAVTRWIPNAVGLLSMHEGTPPVVRVLAAPDAPDALRAEVDGYPTVPELRARLLDGLSTAPGPVRNPRLRDAGFVHWWSVPVFSPHDGDRDLMGSLDVFLREAREPEPIEERVLMGLGSLAAIAVERYRTHVQLLQQATRDPLTGLANREQLVARLRAINEAERRRGTAAVLFLDVDRFKLINDSVGHGAGDEVLVTIGRRLREVLRADDLVARFGGDEFVIVCSGLADVDEVLGLADRLLEVVAQPVVANGLELVVSASVGVALVDGRPPEELLSDADAAMYRAKERGRARIEIFDDTLRAGLVERLETERALRRAVDAQELVVHYQPVVALATGRVTGFEALVRWQHPERGLLAPSAFLDVAEEAGIVAQIGALARAEAFRQWAQWRARHPEWGEFLIGVNLAAAEVRDPSLPTRISAVLSETGVDPGSVVLETSERVLGEDTEAAGRVLSGLRELGVMLALDDFGTGSSPLLHLRRFPINAVKLDQELVKGLGVDRDDDVIVAAVIDLAHRLGLFAVAEGVERPEQAEQLRRDGCLLAQGHLFAPAMAAGDAERWVAERRASGPSPVL